MCTILTTFQVLNVLEIAILHKNGPISRIGQFVKGMLHNSQLIWDDICLCYNPFLKGLLSLSNVDSAFPILPTSSVYFGLSVIIVIKS